MDKVLKIPPKDTVSGGVCILSGTHKGPFVDMGCRPPMDEGGRWLVSKSAVIGMANLLGLPQGRDIERVEGELDEVRSKLAKVTDERDGLLRVVTALRQLVALEGVPTAQDLDDAEAVVAEYDRVSALVGASDDEVAA